MPLFRLLMLLFSLWLVVAQLVGDVPPSSDVEISEVPILMYHVIGDDNGPMQELFVSPAVFRQQMEYLEEQGYHTITLKQLYQHWTQGQPLPPNPIVLTFDDGYRSVYEHAYPIMQQHGFVGVLFIYVNKFNYANSMTVEQLKELLEQGYELGSHTVSHLDLTRLSREKLAYEVAESKKKLEEMFGEEIVSFCYPAGRYNQQVVEQVQQAGYGIAVTTEYGWARKEQGLLTLKRIRINRSDRLQGFIRKLER